MRGRKTCILESKSLTLKNINKCLKHAFFGHWIRMQWMEEMVPLEAFRHKA